MLAFTRLRRARRTAELGERRTLRERGAAALEFALVAPLFFLVVFGGIEIGYMFRSHLSLQDTARAAARVASVERNNADADLAILEFVQSRASTLNGDVTRVVIFGADTLSDDVPEACETGASSQSLNCNVYTVDVAAGETLQDTIDSFAAETGLQDEDRQPWDNLGVYIQYDYNYVTGFFDSIQLGSSSVEVVELDL